MEKNEKSMSLSDDEKMQMLEFYDNNTKKEIILSMQLDESKIGAIGLLEGDSAKVGVIETLHSDESKIKAIEMLESDLAKVVVMGTLQLDESKIKAIEMLESDSAKVGVIETLQLDESKIKAIEMLEGNSAKVGVIETLQSDENKIEQLKKLHSDFDKEHIIKTLKNDESKIKAIELLYKDSYKAKVIKSLQSDKSKIEQLDKLADDFAKAAVIRTLESNENKIEQLEKIKDDEAKLTVVETLKDDKDKIKAIEFIHKDRWKAEIIATLQFNENKIEQLNKLQDDKAKVIVLRTLQSDESKISQLGKLNNYYNKTYIIGGFQDDTKKIEQLNKLQDDYAKAYIIGRIQDDTRRMEQLDKLQNDLAKAIILRELQTIKKITITKDSKEKQLLELLNDRTKLQENFLSDNRKYKKIGLDEKLTIGMEIESEGTLSGIIENLGTIINEQNGIETRGWKTKEEGTLEMGVEVASPILTDNKNDVENIYMVCSMLQKLGQNTSEDCGGHIHIGADYLTSKEAFINLFEIWGNAERIIYKISNDKGQIPRMGMQDYASPISNKLNTAIESGFLNLESDENLEQFIQEIQIIQGNRYSGINLLNINNGENTIEFRIPNGTINPDTWIENAKLFGRIIQRSQELAEIEKQPEQNEEEQKMLELKSKLKEDIPEKEKMEILLELLFNEEERLVYRERYNSNSEILEKVAFEKDPFKQTAFSKVDFKKKKHSIDEFYDVAINNRSEIANDITQETVQGIRAEEQLEQPDNVELKDR